MEGLQEAVLLARACGEAWALGRSAWVKRGAQQGVCELVVQVHCECTSSWAHGRMEKASAGGGTRTLELQGMAA